MNPLWIIYGFISEGGGKGDVAMVVQGSKPAAPHTLHSWLPSLYLDFLPLGLLRLRNIEHYVVV